MIEHTATATATEMQNNFRRYLALTPLVDCRKIYERCLFGL